MQNYWQFQHKNVEKTMFIQVKCPKCGYEGTAIVTTHMGKKVVMDACYKCGAKTTNEQEETIC